jgi:cytolysin-activating lysine-acyltransferase
MRADQGNEWDVNSGAACPTGYDVIAPGLIAQSWSEAAVLGGAVWLWMHSSSHRDMPLHALSALLLPAIKRRQFILISEAGRAVFYLSWANFSIDAEQRYLQQHPVFMPDGDWDSGDRMWLLDWVAPFGHTQQAFRLLRRQLFANRVARMLYHRGDERGMKIKTFQGSAVLPEEARIWFADHPVAVAATRHPTLQQEEPR